MEIPNLAPFIGFVGLHYPDFQAHFTPCIEIGWRLAFEYWGKGYAYEAASKVLEYAFNILHLAEIVSFAPSHNTRSRKLMERLGMIHDLKGILHIQNSLNITHSVYMFYIESKTLNATTDLNLSN